MATPFQLEDLYRFRSVADVQLSPDGATVAYTVTEIDPDSDGYRSAIWVTPAAGGEAKRFSRGRGRDSAPRWSPDGNFLAFLSDRDGGKPQLHLMPTGGGEASQLTDLEHGAGAAVWSPDGNRILFSARVPKAPYEKHHPKVITRAQYKIDGLGYTFGARDQLFALTVASGEVSRLSDGEADELAPAWSPDGNRIAFSRMRSGSADFYVSDLWLMDADGGGARQLTRAVGRAMSPAWSPDGSMIACYGTAGQEPSWGDPDALMWLVPVDGGEPRPLTRERDRQVQTARWPLVTPPPQWSADGTAVGFPMADAGNVHVAEVELATGSVRALVSGERQVTSFNRHAGSGRIAFTAAELSHPGEVYLRDSAGERRLSNVNAEWLTDRLLPRVERREFASPHGGTIDGWLMTPPETTAPAPLLLDIHGGPHSFAGNAFSTAYFYRYLLAAQGWAVLMLNPTGSGSYGRAFARGIRGRWGEFDMPEQLAAVDALVAAGIADGERLAVAGASYGGYMSSWIIGHSDRFKAAAIDAPVVNLESFYGTSDIGPWFGAWQFEGDPASQRERYRRLSPVNYLDRVVTPTLVLHGEDDDRCPIGQGEELFARLVAAGRVPVEFVRYPGGDHGFIVDGRPSHRLDFHRRVAEWLQRYTLGG